MKCLTPLILLMTTISAHAQPGKASTVRKSFSRETTIVQTINADPSIVWSLLTNASDFARWNSTIISLQGNIETGEKIRLKSTLDPQRTFKLKIKVLVPERKLIWGDAMGRRTFTLEKKGITTHFTMSEKIGGLMFPLFANKIPSFDQSFEQFTTDLKKEAETISQSK